MSQKAGGETKRGPLAALFLLLGLVIASVTAPAVPDGAEAAPSRLSQSRAAKRLVLPRGNQRELTAADEDGSADPFVLPPPARIVSGAGAPRAASPAADRRSGLPLQRTAPAYRARAPPAV